MRQFLNEQTTRPLKEEEIIATASRLFSKKGYKATSLIEIADRVGLHKTSLFHYFKSKEDILIAIIEKPSNKHLNMVVKTKNDPQLSALEKFRLVLKTQILLSCEFTDHVNLWVSETRSLSPHNWQIYNKKRKEYESYFEEIVREVQADSTTALFKGVDTKVAMLAVLGMMNWILKWYRPDGRLKPEEIFEAFYRILIQGDNLMEH